MPKAEITLSDTAYTRIRLAIAEAAEHRRKEGGRSYTRLGKHFGINASAAYKIVKRLLWKHIT